MLKTFPVWKTRTVLDLKIITVPDKECTINEIFIYDKTCYKTDIKLPISFKTNFKTKITI